MRAGNGRDGKVGARLVLAAVMVASLTLCGCSWGGGSASRDVGEEPSNDVSGTAGGSTLSAMSDKAVADSEAGQADGESAPSDGGGRDAGSGKGTEDDAPDQAMIRKTADIEMESADFERASAELTSLVREFSTVTLSDSTSRDTSYATRKSRSVTFRVRTERFDEFCERVEATDGAWDITEFDRQAEDVARQYGDTKRQIETLQAKYDWYRDRIDKLTDEKLVMQYSEAMFDIAAEIKALENQNSTLETDVRYSLVSIRLVADTRASDESDRTSDVWEQLGERLTALPQTVSYAVGNLLLAIVFLLPAVIIVAAIAAVAYGIHRLFRKFVRSHARERKPGTPNLTAGQPWQPAPPMPPEATPKPAPAPDAEAGSTPAGKADGMPPTPSDGADDAPQGDGKDADGDGGDRER